MANTPKWRDGRRWCPDCGQYLDPHDFPRRSVSPKRPDGMGTYCLYHQRERDKARRERMRSTAANGSTSMIYGSIPQEDRDAAEDRRWMSRAVYYLGTREPVPGRVVGVRETAHQGLQVWVEFAGGLRVSRQDLIGVGLFKAGWLAFPSAGYVAPSPAPEPEPVEKYVQLVLPLWAA